MSARPASSSSLRRVGRLAARAARLGRRGVRGVGAVVRIARAGLFDPAWYALQEPSAPSSRPLALAHFLVRSATRDLSPHPLLEPSWVGRGTAEPGKPGLGPLLVFVRLLGTPRERSPHPLFDPGAWYADHPHARGHRGGALGHFLATADGDTPLPLPAALIAAGMPAPTLAEAVAAARRAVAGRSAAERLRKAPRWQPTVDLDALAEEARRLAGLPLPAPEPGRPLVSVVTPVRDREGLIGDAIASVRAQTLTDWELLVVDDGSRDGTAAVVADAAAADPRVRLVAGTGEGVSRARNLGAAHATGSYVAWLDSDNTWTPDHLRSVVAALHAAGAEAGYSVVEASDAEGGVRYRALGAPDSATTLDLLRVANHVDLNALVVRRDLLTAIGGFDETLRRTVDYDLVWRIAERTHPLLVGVLGVRYRDVPDPSRITVSENPAWREVVKSRRDVDWAGLAAVAADRRPGVSVLVVARNGWWPAWTTALAALADGSEGGTEEGTEAGDGGRAVAIDVVVVDDAQDRSTAAVLAALALHPRVVVRRAPRAEGAALGLAHALAASARECVAAVDEGLEPWPGTFAALAAALSAGAPSGRPAAAVSSGRPAAAVPLLVDEIGTLRSAGIVGAGDDGPPVALFAGLCPEDARRAGDVLGVDGVAPGACLWRAADVVAVGGPDPLVDDDVLLDDLTARIAAHRAMADGARVAAVTAAVVGVAPRRGRPRPAGAPGESGDRRRGVPVTPAAVAEGTATAASPHWAAAGFEVVTDEDGGRRVRRSSSSGDRTSLRWAIKIAAPVGPAGWHWGDTHFARSLADALTRLGQQVVIDPRPAARRPSEVHDDVVLVLRGLDRVEPPRDAVSLMWLISHPELVDAAELAAYDVVFAASVSWAAEATRRGWGPPGRGVIPLLQATDAARFRPDAAPRDSGEAVLFVGNSRSVRRPVVHDLLAAGVDVALYGRWDGFADPRHVRATFLPNEDVPAAYAAAGVVLNDHWPDMREQGFVSNRLFDAAACGARVVSDDVEGVGELFGGLVRTFSSPQELLELVRGAPHGWSEEPERSAVADRVRAAHSFDARARVLLDAALQARSRRPHPLRAG